MLTIKHVRAVSRLMHQTAGDDKTPLGKEPAVAEESTTTDLQDLIDDLADERYAYDGTQFRDALASVLRAAQAVALQDLAKWTDEWTCPDGNRDCMRIRAGIRGVGKEARRRAKELSHEGVHEEGREHGSPGDTELGVQPA